MQNRLSDIVEGAKKARAESMGEEYVPPVVEEEEDSQEEENGESREESSTNLVIGEGGEDNLPAQEQDEEAEGEVEEAEEAAPEPDEELVTIVVNGEEQQVPKSRVYDQGLRSLQKEVAADRRLAEANERLRAVQALEEQIRAAQQESQTEPPSRQQDADTQSMARQIIDKILDGDEEEATKALAEAMMGRQQTTPAIDPDALTEQVAEKVQQRNDVRSGLKSFQDAYPVIAKDPMLWQRANEVSGRLRSERPELSIQENILAAGKEVQDWLDSLTGGPRDAAASEPTTQHREGKRDKKRTMDNIKTASARVPGKPEVKPKTRADVVAEMRKSRGLSY